MRCAPYRSLVLILLFSCLFLASAQECQLWEGYNTFCKPILDGQKVYVPSGSFQANLSASIINVGLILNFGDPAQNLYANLSCYEAAVNVMCRQAFQGCASNLEGGGTAIPPCRSSCLRMEQACGALFPYFQVNCSNFPVENSTEPQGCDVTWTTISADEACALPAMIYDEGKEMCGVRCPAATYTWGQYDATRIFNGASACVGLVGAVFLFITYSLVKSLRAMPVRWLALCCIFQCVATIPQTSVGWKKFGCAGPTDYEVYREPLSVFQATTYNIGSIGMTSWWLCIGFDLVILVYVKNSERYRKHLLIGYHIFSWGLVALTTITLLALENTTGYSTFAYLAGRDLDLNVAFNTTPLFSMTTIGLLFTALVFLRIWRTHSSALLKGQFRLVLFMVCFLPMNIGIVSTQIWQQTGEPQSRLDRWAAAFGEWLGCLAAGVSECPLPDRYPFWLFMVMTTANVLQMLSPSLIFVTSPTLLRWFREAVRGIWHEKSLSAVSGVPSGHLGTALNTKESTSSGSGGRSLEQSGHMNSHDAL